MTEEKEKLAGENGDYGAISGAELEALHMINMDKELAESMEKDGGGEAYNPFYDSRLLMSDGIGKIDFVLVYETKANDYKLEDLAKRENTLLKSEAEQLEILRHRDKFLRRLQRKQKIKVEEDIETISDKKIIHYLKLSAPWDALITYAEKLSERAPLQVMPNPRSNWSDHMLRKLGVENNVMDLDVPNWPADFYTCPFKISKLSRFIGSNDKRTYFTPAMRIRIMWEILGNTTYGQVNKGEVGIERLLEDGVFAAAYPIHDGPAELQDYQLQMPETTYSTRQILGLYWARWGAWYKYQPLDHIRDYFGEKIGLYFAWLGFYTAWLLPASVVGLLVFLFGVCTVYFDQPTNDICADKTTVLCPQCEIDCPVTNLSSTCTMAKVGYLFDHPGTLFMAIFMSFWAVTFLEFWKRKNATLAHHWDVLDFEEEEERPRPQYANLAPAYERSPITGQIEPAFPEGTRTTRIISGIAAIILMIIIVVIFIIGVILYRMLAIIPLSDIPFLKGRAYSVASMSSSIINLIFIICLGMVYQKLAYKLTEWEMHRTQTEFEDNYIVKVFVFQFVNFYASVLYIGFFKGKFNGYPGNYNTFLGLRNEECPPGGCLVELAQQLGVIMIGKQIINNAKEIAVPRLKLFLQKMKMKKKEGEVEEVRPQWREDYQDMLEYEGLFEEYLEMIIQFGFITIFVAAFPLAPIFALLNNWIEIRLDAQKFVGESRRPVPDKAQDIGVWFTILEVLVSLSVVSNAFLIAFTSDILPQILYRSQHGGSLVGYEQFSLAYSPKNYTPACRYLDFRDQDGNYTKFYYLLLAVKFGFIIIFEHFVFFINRLIDVVIPDIPESVETKIKREKWLAKQALADTD